MKYSKEEVLQYMQEEDVKFIRLAFCDVFGKQKKYFHLCPRSFAGRLNMALPLMHPLSPVLGTKAILISSCIRIRITLMPLPLETGAREGGKDVLQYYLSRRNHI